ncbi:hypothetical protein CALVIDRAFT_215557 [Calocera viscosa TUFC12733]|uniref:Uncharacterized protein n=1 Tax=Calocera viscosa (strain TUFC12733) TaxID=1330018 RepID=A0A167RFG8_CALVF|nr:hypothetical protein CALVIDRAFT_215557 [Calocera viscosa TUFC12733]
MCRPIIESPRGGSDPTACPSPGGRRDDSSVGWPPSVLSVYQHQALRQGRERGLTINDWPVPHLRALVPPRAAQGGGRSNEGTMSVNGRGYICGEGGPCTTCSVISTSSSGHCSPSQATRNRWSDVFRWRDSYCSGFTSERNDPFCGGFVTTKVKGSRELGKKAIFVRKLDKSFT